MSREVVMILSQRLLNAIQNKVQIWEFHDIYSDEKTAKKAAAGLLIGYDGVRLKRTRERSYIIQKWTYPRRQDNGI
jgi:hypothetical protein